MRFIECMVTLMFLLVYNNETDMVVRPGSPEVQWYHYDKIDSDGKPNVWELDYSVLKVYLLSIIFAEIWP